MMDRVEMAALWGLKTANELRDKGLVSGGFPKLDEAMEDAFSGLLASGFVPTHDELYKANITITEMYGLDTTQKGKATSEFLRGDIDDTTH